MIQVVCSNCGIRIHVPVTVCGRVGVCFGCGAQLLIPQQNDMPNVVSLEFKEGNKIDERYIIKRKIGKGGMGVVYNAQDVLIDEKVALKFMNPRMLRTQRGMKFFIQEAQIARRLRHENVVAVHDVSWTSEGILYLSMEFLEGQSLRAFLRKNRQDRKLVGVRYSVSIISQILSALEYAHRTVIHRDIKPENVMLLPGERAKVLDFGLAKATHEEEMINVVDMPQEEGRRKRIIGTLAYSAPEQRKHRPIDSRIDLYAVGLILHELLTLRTPMDEPVSVVDVRNDVSPSLLAVLDRAVQHEKEARWQSAADFRQALSEAYDTSYRDVGVTELHTESGIVVSTEGMKYLEGGRFMMGSNEVHEESPEFEAEIEPFYIDKHPVTVGQYTAFLEATGRSEPKFWHNAEYNGEDQPIVGVSWNDAMAYAAWTGKKLPSEAQWEYAAKGREGRKYPWGNLAPEPTKCNYGENIGMPTMITMHEGGNTPEGISDMAGNVYEWVRDSFVPYQPRLRGHVLNSSNEPRRVVRGGSWHSGPETLHCTHRKGLFPESQLTTTGFRCVVAAKNLS